MRYRVKSTTSRFRLVSGGLGIGHSRVDNGDDDERFWVADGRCVGMGVGGFDNEKNCRPFRIADGCRGGDNDNGGF